MIDYAGRVPFEEITLAGLHKHYLISRTTFYRLFDNTVDVLEYMVDKMAREILLNLSGTATKERILNAIIGLQERRELILMLYKIGRLDIFQKKGEEYIPQSLLAPDENSDNRVFYKLLAYLIPMAMEIWVADGQTQTPEELYQQMHQSVHKLELWFS